MPELKDKIQENDAEEKNMMTEYTSTIFFYKFVQFSLSKKTFKKKNKNRILENERKNT